MQKKKKNRLKALKRLEVKVRMAEGEKILAKTVFLAFLTATSRRSGLMEAKPLGS